MKSEGPVLDRLTHRLTECPGEFLDEPVIGKSGRIRVSAVVSDSMINLGGDVPDEKSLNSFRPRSAEGRNRLRLVLIACWLLNDPWFVERKRFSGPALSWLITGFDGLSSMLDAAMFINDPDRREELARLCLKALDVIPAGETESQAADRLTSLDSIERARIISATREREKRARELREQMKRKEAAEAAAKATRE